MLSIKALRVAPNGDRREEIGDGGLGNDGAAKAGPGQAILRVPPHDRISKTHLLRRIDVFVTAALTDLHQG